MGTFLEYDELFIADFKGSCVGFRLRRRGLKDNHICFIPIVEDDESWFYMSDSAISSFWINELYKQLKHAMKWLHEHPEVERTDWGYKLKDK